MQFIVFKKAFTERIDHNILVSKLLTLGVYNRRSIVRRFCNFLTKRRQPHSEWGFVNAGVAQGIKLGPVLPRVHLIGNMWVMFPCPKLLMQMTLHHCHRTPVQLKTEPGIIFPESPVPVLKIAKLDGDKCIEMIISFLLDEIDIPRRLCIENALLELVTSFKVLGVTLNNKLKWQDNNVQKIRKASKRLHIIRVLGRLPPRNFVYPFFWSFINVPTAILLLNILTAVVLTIEN